MSAFDIVAHPLGRLTMHSLPYYDMVRNPTLQNLINGNIAGFAADLVVVAGIAMVLLITYFHGWRALWGWVTSPDHKKIGIMYVVIAIVMLARALIEAALMRGQLAFGQGGGFLSPDHFAQLFSTHGSIMIFFMAMPFIIGIYNYVMPLQIGARDVAFPVLNSVSLGLTAAGAGLVMISLVLGQFSTGGWFGYPPYTEATYTPGVGPDYWIWALSLSGIGTTFTGINFAVTILKKRAPGMKLMYMPLFSWTALVVAIMMIFAMPPLTVALSQLALDRYVGTHYFTNALGGNQMHFANLFWLFGHPEVYILILPPFGIYSEIFATFSSKTLYGYRSMVLAVASIAVLSFTVWLHHFFTMGNTDGVNASFGIASMLIGIPTGVKIYDWMATMFRGRVRVTTPLIYGLGFLFLFVVGGMSGILLANPTIDFQVHNTAFVVAHFHNVIVPGVVFGLLAAYTYWFPKAFGFRLNETWGKIAAWLWIVGFMLAFFPLYVMGLMGMPRREVAYTQPAYVPLEAIAFFGALVIFAGFLALLIQFGWSVWKRNENRVYAGDPWDGRALEWATSAPPPEYDFAVIPTTNGRDPFTAAKEFGVAYQRPEAYTDIETPRNSPMGPATALFGFLIAFGLVWHIWWLVIVCALGAVGTMAWYGFDHEPDRTIPANEVERETNRWLEAVHATRAVSRVDENTPANQGVAEAPVIEAGATP